MEVQEQHPEVLEHLNRLRGLTNIATDIGEFPRTVMGFAKARSHTIDLLQRKITHVLVGNDFIDWVLRDDDEMSSLFDPVSRHTLLVSGQLGTIFGMSLFSDIYREDKMEFPANTIYFYAEVADGLVAFKATLQP